VNGKVYAIGGNNGSPLGQVDEYDPDSDTWTSKRPMPTARQGAVVAVVRDKIYVTAGRAYTDANDVTYPTSTEVYDPATDTWTVKAPIPSPPPYNSVLGNLFLGGASLGDKIYVVVSAADGSDTLVYDTVSDTWSSMEGFVLKPTEPAAVGIGDKLYVVPLQGGYAFEERMAVLDPSVTPPWFTRGGPPTRRESASIAAWGDGLVVAGGWRYADYAVTADLTAAVEAYDPASDAWHALPDMPTPRARTATTSLPGKLFVLGGGRGDLYTPVPLAVVEEASCGGT
jgi:N-acetylneuraminic acid mutarotase